MPVFRDREEGGQRLAEVIDPGRFPVANPIVFGIPRGGVPVGYALAQRLHCQLDTIVLRKLPIPGDPEAGFGAVTLDKTIVFNSRLRDTIGIPPERIQEIVDRVYGEIVRRDRIYRGDRPFPNLRDRDVIIADDGLATGYTMLAAVEYVRRKKARSVFAAAPVAHGGAVRMLEQEVDSILTVIIDSAAVFAVASFYDTFPEINDVEVLEYLERARDISDG